MHRRQPLPRLWMMTDERQGEELWRALERLPRGAGIVFRHYGLAPAERRALFAQIARRARRRGVMVLFAGDPRAAGPLGAAGNHGGGRFPKVDGMIRSASAHNLAEIRAAERLGTDFVFLSPVFPTRSHPGARPLGRVRFATLASQTRLPVIALGGMNERRARGLCGAYGWAAIDAWSAKPTRAGPARQKRKAVPT